MGRKKEEQLRWFLIGIHPLNNCKMSFGTRFKEFMVNSEQQPQGKICGKENIWIAFIKWKAVESGLFCEKL